MVEARDMAVPLEDLEWEQGPYTSEDYWNLPDGRRAELIDGELYDMTPPSRVHQDVAFGIAHVLQAYVDKHGGPCRIYPAPFAVNLLEDDSTYVEPDVSVICDPSKLSDRGCEGAPDLVVEVVSPSSRRRDYLLKATRYENAGVREYWIVDPDARQTAVYRYDLEDLRLSTYAFEEPVPVGIWGDLSITIAGLL